VGAWVTVDVLLDGPLRHLDHQVSRLMLATGIRDAQPPLGGARLAVEAASQLGARAPMLALTVPAVLLLAGWRRSWRPVLRLALLLVLLGGTVYLAKLAVGRAMPGTDGLHVPANRWAPAGRSFPSGHVPTAVMLWGLLGWLAADYRLPPRLTRALGVLRWLAPALTFVAMLLLDYHWLTDLVAGWAVGVVLLRVGYEIDARALRNWSGAQRQGGQRDGRPAGDPARWAGDPAPRAGDPAPLRPGGAEPRALAGIPGRRPEAGPSGGGRRAAGRDAGHGAGLDGHRAAGLG
jgi:membrane-associated phospholipid phosphatase